ncbi:MAG: hypothetical protein WD472_01300 [Dehalococcoidia bacterium]
MGGVKVRGNPDPDADVTLFFDRNIGTTIPKALLALKPPCGIEWHQLHFAHDAKDDIWMPVVGGWGWFLVGQDYKHHLLPNELTAIKQHNMGAFYLWGSEATKWQQFQVLMKAFDKVLERSRRVPRPFIYRILGNGALTEEVFA